MQTLVEVVFETCKRIKNGRTRGAVLKSCMSELGELADEVAIADGESYKKAGPDGIVGEAGDLVISGLDQIIIEKPDITEAELIAILIPKLAKWEKNVKEHQNV